ncbi:MAG TPA: L-2-hydroxyglutarate oxidase [Chloroflexota bacterium]|nr:L-2-hydroxyglutarate oxidase [Chloroflexota bacterium]
MDFDVTIIGAGAIGCALAREIARQHPLLRICVVEAEPAPAMHQSGRNSGVCHSGFNPAPGTLKARLCVEGNQLLREFCHSHSVAFQDVGTVVTAVTEVEIERLEKLHQRGVDNGVPGIRLLSLQEARALEPNLADGIQRVMHAPSGAILDSKGYVRALALEGQSAGVTFHYNARLLGADEISGGYRLRLSDGDLVDTARVVNASGVHVDTVAMMFGWRGPYRIVPFRGSYWDVRGKNDIIRSMVYPVPDPAFPFLGVHVTKRVDGGVMLGPNAMLAFGRESYRFWNVNVKDMAGMVRQSHFWQLMRRPEVIKHAVSEVERSLSAKRFAAEASLLVKGIEPEDLAPGPPAGIRAQLVDEHGDLVEDFLLDVSGKAAHILNAVSPGLTSSLAFARYLTGYLDERNFLSV